MARAEKDLGWFIIWLAAGKTGGFALTGKKKSFVPGDPMQESGCVLVNVVPPVGCSLKAVVFPVLFFAILEGLPSDKS